MRVIHKLTQPSPTLRIILFVVLNVVTSLVALSAMLYIPQLKPSLIFIPTIAFCAWYGGFFFGLIATMISIFSMIGLIFYPTHRPFLLLNPLLAFDIAIFFFVSIFISYVIHIAKQQDKITEYQRKLRQSHRAIETLEKYYDSAQIEIQARDQFLAIASHELKTPVTSMLLQVQTAIHNIRNVSLANFSVATLLKMLEDTEQQSKRLSKMVNDLLDLSLITTGKIDLEIEETNISNMVLAIVDRFAARLPDKNQLHVVIKKPIIVQCDKLRVEQAVINLISNAIKYGDNKPILVEVVNTNDHVRISVSDQGIGIQSDQQKKIFNRFERAVSSQHYKGLGVGLYVTYQIVKAHNGKIHLKSQLNKGATFIIELPLKQTKK